MFCDASIGRDHAFAIKLRDEKSPTNYYSQIDWDQCNNRIEPYLYYDHYMGYASDCLGEIHHLPYKNDDDTKFYISYDKDRKVKDEVFSTKRELAIINIYRESRSYSFGKWTTEKYSIYRAYAIVCKMLNHIDQRIIYKVENDGVLFKEREEALDFMHSFNLNALLARVDNLEKLIFKSKTFNENK